MSHQGSLATMIQHTPTWVGLIFVYFIIRGLRATKDRTVSIKKLCITPVIFIILSMHTLVNIIMKNQDYYLILVWLISFAFFTVVSHKYSYKNIISVNKEKSEISLKGGYSTLIIIITIFLLKYYATYKMVSNPEIINSVNFIVPIQILYSACTGVFAGKVIGYYRSLNKQAIS